MLSVTRFLKKDGVRDMGRGRGGYTEKQPSYKDSGGYKVTDKGAIFVAERYMDQGYEAVFRRRHDPDRGCDLMTLVLTYKISYRRIRMHDFECNNPSKMSTRIGEAAGQISEGDTVAIFLPNHRNSQTGRALAEAGIAEARRKGYVKGPIEVWFSDKTCEHY